MVDAARGMHGQRATEVALTPKLARPALSGDWAKRDRVLVWPLLVPRQLQWAGAPKVSGDTVEAVAIDTLETTPGAHTHWSCRGLATNHEISHSAVADI